MKKLRILIVVIFALILSLQGESLPYDYIDNSTPNITKDNVEQVAQYNAMIRKRQTEPSGFMLGIGASIGYPLFGENERFIGGSYDYRGYKIWWDKRYSFTGFSYGANMLLGYKWFFTRVFGIRLYADYNPRFLKVVVSHNITANFDFMFNIISTQSFKFGVFFGFGLGGAAEQVNMKYCLLYPEESCKKVLGAFSGSGNVGLRFVINDNSAIEALAQISGIVGREDWTPYDFYFRYNAEYSTQTLYGEGKVIDDISVLGTLRFIYTF